MANGPNVTVAPTDPSVDIDGHSGFFHCLRCFECLKILKHVYSLSEEVVHTESYFDTLNQ